MKYYIPEYHKFSVSEVLEKEAKWKNQYPGQHMVSGYDKHVIVKLNSLSMLVLYTHSFLGKYDEGFEGVLDSHFSFYALTDGWDSFADTGCMSLHLAHREYELPSDDVIKQRAIELIRNNGFVMPDVVQQSMF